MLLHLKEILSPDEVRQAREILANAPWGDGKVTSGQQSALVKNNSQLPEHCAESKQLQKLVLDGLTRDPLFFSAALPKRISPPLFNHYGGAANSFGDHVDTSVRYDLGDSHPLVGRSVPEFELTDGTRPGDLLRTGKGLLLDFGAGKPLQEAARRWNGSITYVAGDAKDKLGVSAVLVRPDGIVAWVWPGAGSNANDTAAAAKAFTQAASRWFCEV